MGDGRRVTRPWVRVLLWLAIGVFAWFALSRLVGAVDWPAVGAAFGRLSWWVAAPLLGALLLRQALNAVPLTFYVPGLGLARSMQNDLAANLVATFAPPPSDIVLRVTMFRSWRLDPVLGMTGVTLNTAKFYAVRFTAPVLGLVLAAGTGIERRQWVVAALCGLVAVALLTGLVLLLRSEALAARLGRLAGRIARRVRRTVEPEQWAQGLVRIRREASGSLRRGLAPSMAALVGMVLADALVLVVALRAVGVPADALPLLDVLAAFLLAYPLTLLPLFGLGVLDALVVGTWATVAGVAFEPELVAATIVWRVVTIGGTLLLGLLVVTRWRRQDPAG